LLEEVRRRAYLSAMQVLSWVPRTELPFAAPSRPGLLVVPVEPKAEVPTPETPVAEIASVVAPPTVQRAPMEIPCPLLTPGKAEPVEQAASEPKKQAPPPRFALQLLRAGACLILVELPTGEPFQSRDPAYVLLKDLLRAAGLPNNPLQVGDGEPIRWPLRGLDASPEAARDYVQGVLSGELEENPATCLWLVGLPAVRFAGEADAQAFDRELQVDGLGLAWALPGLELLMDEPQRKASLWQAMRRVMVRWNEAP
jgi:hypothetical protein